MRVSRAALPTKGLGKAAESSENPYHDHQEKTQIRMYVVAPEIPHGGEKLAERCAKSYLMSIHRTFAKSRRAEF